MMEGESVVHDCGREGVPDIRLLHFNDVYHIEAGSREPIGGIARFQGVCNHYRDDASFKDQPTLFTLFSGDAFNPSLESSVTKGAHMVPVLNDIGTDCACVGNHDLDFGVPKFRELASQCKFPWLLANVLDPALGTGVPLGNAKPTLMLESSNGIKIGLIGIVEREWLDTINSLPPNLIYKSASATVIEWAPKLREQGADMIIMLSHQREPNDNKVAEKIPAGTIDIILGGHDHYYNHTILNGTHVLRSGADFKQLSYLKAWRKKESGWDFKIVRHDVLRALPEVPAAAALVEKITSKLKSKLDKPVGYTAAPLDARFTTVRKRESNFGNLVCDIMCFYHDADCAIMAAGTIRGDQVYPPGIIRMADIMNCFPFEDPVVVVRVTGADLRAALENSVSTYPAQEGRFPQVSNIRLTFDADAPVGKRVTEVLVGGQPLDLAKKYVVATRDYMCRGKDGFETLLYEENGGPAETVVSEENGILISMMLRQYFTSLKVVAALHAALRGSRMDSQSQMGKAGSDDHMGSHWAKLHAKLHDAHPVKDPAPSSPPAKRRLARVPTMDEAMLGDEEDSGDDEENPGDADARAKLRERRRLVAQRVLRHWRRVAHIQRQPECAAAQEEIDVDWTKGVAPRVEGRIIILNEKA